MSEKHDHDSEYHELNGEAAREKIAELVKGVHIAVLTTLSGDNAMSSRPMAVQNTPFNGTLWFLTRAQSEKMGEIAREHHVLLTFAEPKDSKYLVLKGRAEEISDRAKIEELWNPLYKAWFPNGPQDPEIAVLKVTVSEGDYWEASSSRVIMLAKYAFAAATGGKMPVGEAGHVTV